MACFWKTDADDLEGRDPSGSRLHPDGSISSVGSEKGLRRLEANPRLPWSVQGPWVSLTLAKFTRQKERERERIA